MNRSSQSSPSQDEMAIALQLVADDRETIPYRRRFNRITGAVTASILFQQAIFHWRNNKRRPFFKFMEPTDSSNRLYREGDSWTEELGFTRYEFESARELIATKIKKGGELPSDKPIAYWRDGNNLTWYAINEQVAAQWIYLAYNPVEANGEKSHSLPCRPRPIVINPHSRMRKSHIRDVEKPRSMKWGKSRFPISEKETLQRFGREVDPLHQKANSLWETAYGQLQLQMPREAFDTWLRGARLVEYRNDAVPVYLLGVPNIYAREWLEHRLKKIVVRALTQIAGQQVDVKFVLWADHIMPEKTPDAGARLNF